MRKDARKITKAIYLALRKPVYFETFIRNRLRKSTLKFDYFFRSGFSFPPRYITFFVTDQCNMDCLMCFDAHAKAKDIGRGLYGMMKLNLFQNIIDQLSGKPLIILAGGEPLLHPQIHHFINYAKKQGLPCSLTSNGLLLEKRAQDLASSNLDSLVISLDGVQETNDRIRGVPGGFKKVQRGIRKIANINNRPLLFINSCISDVNYNELEKIVHYAEEEGIDGINFNLLWFQTQDSIRLHNKSSTFSIEGSSIEVTPSNVNTNLLIPVIKAIKTLNTKLIINFIPELDEQELMIYYNHPEISLEKRSICGWLRLQIAPNGDVWQCRELNIGNLGNQSLRELWNCNKYRKFRMEIREKGTFPICNRCCYVFPSAL